MRKRLLFLFLLLCFCQCSQASLQDCRAQAECEIRQMMVLLRQVHSPADIDKHFSSLRKKFLHIADLVEQVHSLDMEEEEFFSPLSEELFIELARIYEIPGCRQKMAQAQEEAIQRVSRVVSKS